MFPKLMLIQTSRIQDIKDEFTCQLKQLIILNIKKRKQL